MTVLRSAIGNIQVAFLSGMSWAKKPMTIKNPAPWYKNRSALSEAQKRVNSAFASAAAGTRGLMGASGIKERNKVIANSLSGKSFGGKVKARAYEETY